MMPAGVVGLSLVVPVYNEAGNLPSFHARLLDAAHLLQRERGLGIEIVYIDDGSKDDTLEVARGLAAQGVSLQILSLSRNFGKEAALLAGLDHARGAALLFIDGDGQHPPEMIPQLVAAWQDEGFDVIYTAKAHRGDETALKKLAVKNFYRLMNWGARQKIPENAGDFRLLSPRAAEALRQLPERNRFFKGLSSWIGFRQKRIDYVPAPRTHGRSSWNLKSLLGLSIEGLTAFSVTPLRVATVFGFVLAATAFLYGLWIILSKLVFGIEIPGYPSLMVGLMVIGGVQLVMIGILGEYIGKILSEIKHRPVYFVQSHDMLMPQADSPSTRLNVAG